MIEQHSDKARLGHFLVGDDLSDYDESLFELALFQGVGVFCLYRLEEQGIHLPDSTLFQQLKNTARQQTVQQMIRDKAISDINRAMFTAGIMPIWLKGAALSHIIYPQPALRQMADLDLIVPVQEFQPALEILKTLGYYDPDMLLKSPINKLMHHAHLVHNKFTTVHVELHHKLLGHGGQEHLPLNYVAEWLQQSIEFDVNEQIFYTLKPELHFIYLCAHIFLQHGEAQITIRHLLDLHLIVEKYDLDWNAIIDEAVKLRWTYLVEQALNRIEDYFNTPVPSSVSHMLVSRRTADENIDFVKLKSHGDIRGESTLWLFKQLTLREQITGIWQIGVPPEYYMRKRYNIPASRAVAPYYLYRWFEQARGILQALFRRLLLKLNLSRFSSNE